MSKTKLEEILNKFIVIGAPKAVGMSIGLTGVEVVKAAHDIGEKIVPHVEKYVSLIPQVGGNIAQVGSSAVEYGIPALVGLGFLYFTYVGTKATDEYLLEHQFD